MEPLALTDGCGYVGDKVLAAPGASSQGDTGGRARVEGRRVDG